MSYDDDIPGWRRYLRFWRANARADVSDELEFHLQSTIDELVASGMSPDAARDLARRKFGDVDGISKTLYTLSRERERYMARGERISAVKQDLVYGLRQLRKSPAFTAVAVLTLALGIGANTAIFSVVYSVLLRPLPYANADRIVGLVQRNGSNPNYALPFGNYDTWRHEATGFDAIGAVWFVGPSTLTGMGEPAPIPTTLASAGYWKAMFIPPVLGRYFTEDEDREGGPRAAIISRALWQSRFAGDSGVIGRTITLASRPVTIVGVAPTEYVLTPPFERLWLPLAPAGWRLNDFSDHELTVYGRLKSGISSELALRQLTQIETGLAAAHPNSGYDGGVIATSIVDKEVGPHRTRLYLLLGAVALVLLIACGNIANLLLARANVRRAEIAIRGALGATRGRIVGQLLAESVLLAVAGGALGLIVAVMAMRFLVTSPAAIPRLQNAALNLPVLAFTLVLSIGCAILFGLVPAMRAARLDLQQTLRDGGRESQAGARERLRGALVVGELCIAQVLLVGAGLLIRSSMLLQSVPVGFDSQNLLAASISVPYARYPNIETAEATFQQIDDALSAIPGVRAIGRSQVVPIYGRGYSWNAFREGSNGHDDGAVGSNMRFVSANYFNALGLRVARGRPFTRADGRDAPPVAIVSRGLARQLYGDADPIGKRIGNGGSKNPGWREIVGVVDDMHADGLAEEPPRELYIPSTQRADMSQTILIRGAVPVTTLVPPIRAAIAKIDPLLALSNVSTMEQALAKQTAMSRFTTWLLALLGATGLVLAIVGVYGVIAYFVTQRTREFGVRLALGASGGAVQWMVVRQGVVLAAMGVTLGALLSLASTKLLATMMFGITPHDPVTFAVVAGLLAAVAIVASYVPARRATRIDPLEALRSS